MIEQYKYNLLLTQVKWKNQINIDNNTVDKIIKLNKLQNTIRKFIINIQLKNFKT